MADLRELHARAGDAFGRRVAAVDGRWAEPTPCSEWNVRALVNHLVYENRWAPDLLAGRTVEEVGSRYDGDLLGSSPEAAWSESWPSARAAFAPDDALDRTVHLSYADVPGREYLGQLVVDLTVHGWDLARALGDDDTMDPELVAFAWDLFSPDEEMLRASGMFGQHVPVDAEADAQTRLLALMGRRR